MPVHIAHLHTQYPIPHPTAIDPKDSNFICGQTIIDALFQIWCMPIQNMCRYSAHKP